jgi:hypothetical protein
MPLCNSSCLTTLEKHVTQSCGIVGKKGGINKIIITKCDTVFSDITDLAEWAALIASGDIVATEEVLGQKPKGSFTKKRFGSCSPESVIAGEQSITFIDYNTDENGGQQEFIFWNSILEDSSKFQVGYLTCEGLFVGFIPTFSIEVGDTMEDNQNGSWQIEGTITWQSKLMEVPYLIPGLAALFA